MQPISPKPLLVLFLFFSFYCMCGLCAGRTFVFVIELVFCKRRRDYSMPKSKAKKAEELTEIESILGADIEALVVVTNKGMSVKQVEALRRAASAAGAKYKVPKNSISKLAIADTQFSAIADFFKGPTAIIVSKDPVAAAKVAQKYAKEYGDKLAIVGGSMGSNKLDAKSVVQLASLPSLDELRGKLVGLLQAPATKIAGVLQAPAGQLARVVGAYAAK